MSATRMERLRLAGIALVGCLALGLTGAGSALAETVTFKSTGKEQEFKVPAGVTSVHVAAIGSEGGKTASSAPGGLGGVASGDLTVVPGQVLYVEVGGVPFNGGGLSGSEEGENPLGFADGGSGGGASDVRTVSIGAEPSPGNEGSLKSRLLVAAGGGGGGAEDFEKRGCAGGAGGGAGEKGANGTSCGFKAGEGGGAGETAKGGEGGQGYDLATPTSVGDGGAGRLGGGGGGGREAPFEGFGGGGGGGVFGGGGGGAQINEEPAPNEHGGNGGGGGGSNLVPAGGLGGTAKAGEEPSVTITYTVKTATTLTTQLSGEGKKGEKITVKEGEAVTDQATLSGENASTATGTATYNVYGDSGCTKLLGTVSSAVSGGKSETSPLTFVEAGTYYWQVSYSGDENNQGSEDTCGAEVLTVTPKPATSTCGKTTVGKSSAQLLANFKRVNQCTLPVNATLSEMSIYLTPTSHSGSQLIKGIVYGDSKGSPTGLLGTTIQLTFTSKSKAGWYHLAFATPLKLAAGNYWIGMITGASQYVGAERYDSVANAQDSNTNSYTAGASKTFGSFNKGNEQMSLYATFTPEVQRCAAIRPNTIC
jgi:hypothetical protein